jgi:putative transcriptional regulator
MTFEIDFSLASSKQIEKALSQRLENIRLLRNMTQTQLAKDAGISLKTLGRLESGQGVSLDTFIRVLIALRIQGNMQNLLPDPSIRPVERMRFEGTERKRARPNKSKKEDATWTWGDETEKPE